MKIALAQINPVIGDFPGNRKKILEYSVKALDKGAALVVFPELCLCGYPPLDLLDQDAFYIKNEESLEWLLQHMPEKIAAAVGHIAKNTSGRGKPYHNTITVLKDGKQVFSQGKTLLPSYDVFDETRYFEPASESLVFSFAGKRIGIAVCEDLWRDSADGRQQGYEPDPVGKIIAAGADIIIAPSASPFFAEKKKTRLELISRISKKGGIPVVYVNSTGGNDSLVFDGNSMVTDSKGQLIAAAEGFAEDLIFFDTEKKYAPLPFSEDYYGDIESALVLGLKDYLVKCGFSRVHLGLSGGIDSALTAVIAVKAAGKENVGVFAMPSHFSSENSMKDASALAENLGIKLDVIPVKKIYDTCLEELQPFFKGKPFDLAEENLQARIRGTLMMAYSNKWNSLLLNTGNKSELSTGYCTLYGDMAGGISVIGDLFKTDVYGLCRYINRKEGNIIPEEILAKPPTAELRADQKDSDSLPEYDVLDSILKHYILENMSKTEIVELGFPDDIVSNIIKLVARAEYKRIQAPPVIKISQRAFGIGRRMPLARKIYED